MLEKGGAQRAGEWWMEKGEGKSATGVALEQGARGRE